jgi:hypothetical protein
MAPTRWDLGKGNGGRGPPRHIVGRASPPVRLEKNSELAELQSADVDVRTTIAKALGLLRYIVSLTRQDRGDVRRLTRVSRPA